METGEETPIERISAITLVVSDMAASVDFYRSLGFSLRSGGATARFTTFAVGDGFLNLAPGQPPEGDRLWGRAIFYVRDVDAMHERAEAAGHRPEAEPRNAEWGERYFHLRDPDGHQLSFARPLEE